MMRNRLLFFSITMAFVTGTVPAAADLTISNAPTKHVRCSNGYCFSKRLRAVLNVGDLETMLASGNIQVQTASRRGLRNIIVSKPLSWSASTTLTLGSTEDIQINRAVLISGGGGLAIYPGNGRLAFGPRGSVVFSNLSSALTIGNYTYTLLNSLPSLVSAIAVKPNGIFALANPYDASVDGTYSTSPISTTFVGAFEGLGNSISNISVSNTSGCCVGGLFQTISSGAGVYDVNLANVNVTSSAAAGGLAYDNFGSIYFSHVTGTVAGGGSGDIGGLVGDNYGTIEYSYSAATTSAASSVTGVNVGGLAGQDFALIEYSFATGAVTAGDGSGNLGGLIGQAFGEYYGGSPQNCYATGAVSGGAGLNIGGLIGLTDYSDYNSGGFCYSTGAVSGGSGSTVGGLIGVNSSFVYDDYWDTTTAGTNVGVGVGNAGGVTGLTTEQLQSGLPNGFQSTIWGEAPKINGGLPYLLYNPPLH